MIRHCLDILFPPSCAVCTKKLPLEGSRNFCNRCTTLIHYLRLPLCRICGLEVHGEATDQPLCGECLRTPPPFSIARSVVRYETMVQRVIHKLKYNNDTSVLAGLRELINGHDMSLFADCDCIIPVPLHLQRLRRRGMNQALILAKLFFPDCSEKFKTDCLVRTRNTVPQTELGGLARRGNLKDAFQIRVSCNIVGLVVCLVDDVYTTGTTVRECSKTLINSGAKKVKVLTLARAGTPQRGR